MLHKVTMFLGLMLVQTALASGNHLILGDLQCEFANGVSLTAVARNSYSNLGDKSLSDTVWVETKLGMFTKGFNAQLKKMDSKGATVELTRAFDSSAYMIELNSDSKNSEKQTVKAQIFSKSTYGNSAPKLIADGTCEAQAIEIPKSGSGRFLVPVMSFDKSKVWVTEMVTDAKHTYPVPVNKTPEALATSFDLLKLKSLDGSTLAGVEVRYMRSEEGIYNDFAEAFCAAQDPSLGYVRNSTTIYDGWIWKPDYFVQIYKNKQNLWVGEVVPQPSMILSGVICKGPLK